MNWTANEAEAGEVGELGEQPTVRGLRVLLEARAAGLAEPFVAVIVGYCTDRPREAPRARHLAGIVQAAQGLPELLRQILWARVNDHRLLHAMARVVNPRGVPTPTGDRALRGIFT